MKTKSAKTNIHFTERPCAAEGLISYRYKGRYGWIMIGANSNEEAISEAKRSTTNVLKENLQVWENGKYENAYGKLTKKIPVTKSL